MFMMTVVIRIKLSISLLLLYLPPLSSSYDIFIILLNLSHLSLSPPAFVKCGIPECCDYGGG